MAHKVAAVINKSVWEEPKRSVVVVKGRREKVDEEKVESWQCSLLKLQRQMATVSRQAEDLFLRLERDVEQVSSRCGHLKDRISKLETATRKLQNPKTLRIGRTLLCPPT